MAPLLGYWEIRSLCQPLRLLMEYAGMEYEEKRYVCGPPPTFDKSCWYDIKYKLGLDFPNLPYYIDGDLQLTQSSTILRYLARKADLMGKSQREVLRADMVLEQVVEMRDKFFNVSYDPNFDALKENYSKSLPDQLQPLEDFLGTNKWFAGENITYCDFVLFEMLDQLQFFKSDVLSATPNLKRFHTQFKQLPAIEAYMKSPKYIKYRINDRQASFGNGYEN